MTANAELEALYDEWVSAGQESLAADEAYEADPTRDNNAKRHEALKKYLAISTKREMFLANQ
jgi:hypothetical protein